MIQDGSKNDINSKIVTIKATNNGLEISSEYDNESIPWSNIRNVNYQTNLLFGSRVLKIILKDGNKKKLIPISKKSKLELLRIGKVIKINLKRIKGGLDLWEFTFKEPLKIVDT